MKWKRFNNAAVANERACYEQYQMARDGARIQDKESARSLVAAAQGTVNEVEALLQDARLVAPESVRYRLFSRTWRVGRCRDADHEPGGTG